MFLKSVCPTCPLTVSPADDLHDGRREEANAVRPSLRVVDVALPAPVHVLFQHLQRGQRGHVTWSPDAEMMKEAWPHRDDVSCSNVEGRRVVEVPVILQRSDLQDACRICGGKRAS